jgi:ferritin-like metal-binding protein YciE
MKDVVTLKDLMIYYLQSLLDTESKWCEAIAEAMERIKSPELRGLLIRSAEVSRHHLRILGEMLENLGFKKEFMQGVAVKGLLIEVNEILQAAADPEVRDAAFIVKHQCINHYKIAQYGALSSYANLLGEEKLAAILHHLLLEEKESDAALTKLAESKINPQAQSPLIM